MAEPIKNPSRDGLKPSKLSTKKILYHDRMNLNHRFPFFTGEVQLIHVLDLKRFCATAMEELSNTIKKSSRDGLKPSKLSTKKILYHDRVSNGGSIELRASENRRPALEMTVLNDLDSISRLEGF